MKQLSLGAACGAALLAFSTAASATVLSATNASEHTGAPGLISNGSPGSTTEYLWFNEIQGYTLTADLLSDQGVVAAGTRIDSHMILLNRGDRLGGSANIVDLDASFTFSGDVLGTMSDEDGGLRMVPSDFLGVLAGYSYSNFGNRGLENGGGFPDTFSFTGATLDAQFNVSQPGDWMRVVTASQVPVPAGLLLLPTGLFALGAMRRKKRKAS